MAFHLYPVPIFFGGHLVYPAEQARDALCFYRDWIKTVPDELTSTMAIVKFPSLPPVPEAMRGKTEVSLWATYAGDAAEGEALIQVWLDWRTPVSNTFREMPFSEIGSITNDPVEPTAEYGSSDMFDELSDEAIDIIVRYATDSASPLIVHVLRHAGGAIARVPPHAGAIGHRDAPLFLLMGGAAPTPEARAVIESYASETYERLLALKAKYDPDNGTDRVA